MSEEKRSADIPKLKETSKNLSASSIPANGEARLEEKPPPVAMSANNAANAQSAAKPMPKEIATPQSAPIRLKAPLKPMAMQIAGSADKRKMAILPLMDLLEDHLKDLPLTAPLKI